MLSDWKTKSFTYLFSIYNHFLFLYQSVPFPHFVILMIHIFVFNILFYLVFAVVLVFALSYRFNLPIMWEGIPCQVLVYSA